MNVRCKYDELVNISALKSHPKNRNKHPKEQIQRLAKILEYQGWRYPVKVSLASHCVTSGHGRIEAAKLNGWTKVPVNYQEYESEEQEYADVQSDNAIAAWAELDLSRINADIGDLGPDFDIDLLGIEGFEIDAADKDENEDNVPERPSRARTAMGDLYLLGEHRLLCGDSTDRAQVERLMNGEKADVFLTDPPYGVSYADKNAYLNMIAPANRIQVGIENDHGTIEESGAIWLGAYQAAIESCSDRASFYIFSPQGGDLMMMMMIQKAGWTLKHMLVWVKNNHVLGRCDYHYKHEPIFYGWNKVHDFYGGSSCFSVLQYPKPMKNDLHPTMKPIELLEHLISNSSLSGGKVLDSFSGSGSTLIACEKTNRRCFGMEIDPLYCDVILDRWAKYTGQEPKREDGIPWSYIKEGGD